MSLFRRPPGFRVLRLRAALLLEVVIALAVLVTAMGLLAAQLAGGLNMTTYSQGLRRIAADVRGCGQRSRMRLSLNPRWGGG